MTTCFIFTHGLTEKGCLSLSLDEEGEISDDLRHRSFEEIKGLPALRILVLPTQLFSLHTLALPWIPEKKARTAIPFALEEQLAQPVTELHFAFDRAFHEDGRYLITVGEKSLLIQLIEQFKSHDIPLEKITLDWFALHQNESLVTKDYVLINNTEFQGVVDTHLAASFLNAMTLSSIEQTYFNLKAATKWCAKNNITSTEVDSDLETWVARRLHQKKKVINLLQGDFQAKHLTSKTRRYYIVAAIAVLFWFGSFLSIHLAQLPSLNRKLAQVDSEIAKVYRSFFPQAKQVINPRFRINQLLKTTQNKSNLNFWFLLNLLAKNIKDETIEFEKIRFQNQTLFVTFSTKSFEELENFQNRLNKSKAKVKQTQASTHQEKILGTLELTL